MMSTTSPGLTRFYAFFESWGRERLDGLDASHFRGLTVSETEEAWNFLEKNLAVSLESTRGLYLINPLRAVEKFKKQVYMPIAESTYRDQRCAREENRTLMLHLILSHDPAREYVEILNAFASSEFADVRARFADYLPVAEVSQRSLDLLKEMIFTETDSIARSLAISKFMAIRGYNFKFRDERYKALYRALTSSDEEEKKAAIQQIENGRSI